MPKKSTHRTYLTPIRFTSTTEAAAVEATEGQEAAGEPVAAAPESKQQRNRRAVQGRRKENIGTFLNSMSNSIRRFNSVNRGDFLSAVHVLRQAPCK